MAMCAFLGITREMLEAPAPYTRILAFNEKGRKILKAVKKQGFFLNAGEDAQSPYQSLEHRAGDLYALFAENTVERPGMESRRRVYYQPELTE
jgi:hypothetical protein